MSKLKVTMAAMACVCALTAVAAPRGKRGPVGADGGETVAKGRAAKVTIDSPARPGSCLCLPPSLQANGSLMGPLGGKPRQWTVLEMKFSTFAKWQDELTVTWHVLLDSDKATEKDTDKELAPPKGSVSYYTAAVRYVDLKKGGHMASVCLPPSCHERYGDPVTISVTITNKEGDELATDTQSTWSKKLPEKWWQKDDVMNWQMKGKNMVMRRQGLMDRSKTPFWLVNPQDYEQVQ